MRTPETVAGMQCPICRVSLAMSDRQGIEIDYCPQCRGVWLDRGELDKIIERSVPEPTAIPKMQSQPQSQAPWPARDYRGQDPRPHKRKKSFFEELFD